MQGKRVDRVGHLVQMQLSELIVTKLKDPRIGLVTVTHVEMSPDLKTAMVYYSVLGDAKVRERSQQGLKQAAGFLQHQIAGMLKLRHTPKLEFRFDDSLDQGMAIDRVLRELENKDPES